MQMANEAEQYLGSLDAPEFPVQEVTEEPEPEDCSTLPYDEQMSNLRRTVMRQPLHREIHYQILTYAQTMRTLGELEEFIAGLPQFREATQPQYYLIQFLVNSGGLTEFDLDADGNIISDDDKAGLSEDELDDLIETWGYETTDLGRDLANEMKPSARMSALLAEFPDWEPALIDTVSFLETKRSTSDLNRFLLGLTPPKSNDERMQVGVFVDRLEKVGVIVWDDRWSLTDEGREFLDEYKSRTAQ